MQYLSGFCGHLALVSLALFVPVKVTYAESKSVSWTDANYVPCEGLGATATGKITANVDFASRSGTIKVTRLQIHTEYQHAHEPSANLRFQQPSGAGGNIVMQKAWFDTIGPDDNSQDLFLPRNGSGSGPAAQTPFEIASGSGILISINTRFPQNGGNCLSSFSETLLLP
ncbi:hypothetical protein [Ensifer adhaerens]|uniref:hypothetical protein n=1 Tax=Ensifer adhaerens TaxID=106592 RepID=UPI001C4DF71A|nr:hypothetical protein [Ensifer adhaerens]MBW0365840.1 hypothetical protein [Ensifer adhaerens]UCM20255.1 hypothetical protein LDL63_01215 [Ensifer adhaerens]